MVGNGKHRWGNPFSRSGSPNPDPKSDPPREFLCPISGSLMSDPVVVPSGQTFERVSVQACADLSYSPVLDDGSRPDFSALIPNLALRKTISNWCERSGAVLPPAADYSSVSGVIRAKISQSAGLIRPSERDLLRGVAENPVLLLPHAVSEVAPRAHRFHSASSEESVVIGAPSPDIPLPLTLRPLCYSSLSSTDFRDEETLASDSALSPNPNPQEEELLSKLTSDDVFSQENAAIQLRKITRSKADSRSSLCTPRLIAALKPLIASPHSSLQANATASMVNLSLESSNKVKIVRSGVVPLLIDVLKGGFNSVESQEHAAGALFSLALDDDNKMVIGVLGALPPLLHALRSESERTRHDCALALYNLTLVKSSRIKLIKLNAIPTLLEMVKSGNLVSQVLLILCNLAACVEGRSNMLDSNAVGILVGLLRENRVESEATRENCVAALYALSHGSLRFKGVARDAGAIEVLREVEESGTDRAREKAKRLLELLKGREGGGEEDLYRALPTESDTIYRARHRGGRPGGTNLYNANSTDF